MWVLFQVNNPNMGLFPHKDHFQNKCRAHIQGTSLIWTLFHATQDIFYEIRVYAFSSSQNVHVNIIIKHLKNVGGCKYFYL